MEGTAQSALLGTVRPISTGQPRRAIRRPAQYAKAYAYAHLWETLGSGAVGTRRTFTVDANTAYFEVHRIAALADNLAFKVLIQATPMGEMFMTAPLFGAALGGGQRPTILSPPWVMPRNTTITGVADDRQLVAAAQNVRIAYIGAKVYTRPIVPERLYTGVKYFEYCANFTANDDGAAAIAANQTAIFSLKVDPDSDFEVQKIVVVSDYQVTVQIRTDSDNWFDTDLRGELLGGSEIETPALPGGWYPFILPAPRLVSGGSYISTSVTDKSGASNRCQVIYMGQRLYPGGGA